MAAMYTSTAGLLCIMCAPGTYKQKDCGQNYTSAVCAPCPDNHFQTTHNEALSCAKCRTFCDVKFQTVTRKCIKTRDSECQCSDGYFFEPALDGKEGHCVFHRKCPPGQGVAIPGNSSHDTLCEPCQPGFDSTTTSAVEHCVPSNNTSRLEDSSLDTQSVVGICFGIIICTFIVLGTIVSWKHREQLCGRSNNNLLVLTQIPESHNLNTSNTFLTEHEAVQMFQFISKRAFSKDFRRFLRNVYESTNSASDVDCKIELYEETYRAKDEVVYQTLKDWRQKNPQLASLEIVIKALRDTGISEEIIRSIMDKYKEIKEEKKPVHTLRSISYVEGCTNHPVTPPYVLYSYEDINELPRSVYA